MGTIENAIMKDNKLQQIVKRSLVSYQREIENKTGAQFYQLDIVKV